MAQAPSDCLFCKIVAGEVPATRVRDDERRRRAGTCS
jgi:hypothetical protein